MKNIYIALCAVMMILASSPAVRAEKTFGMAQDYLQYGAGARSLGMGGAFTGVADDASAAYWNPAALAYLDEYQLLTMYAPFMMDTQYNYASVAIPLGIWGALSVSDVMLKTGGFQERNDLNVVTGEDKSIIKNSASMSYAKSMYDLFSAGVRVNFLQERVFSTSGDAFGLDGSMYLKPWHGISAGLSVNNINRPKITLIESPDVYGRQTRCGVAYHGKKDVFIVAVDANKLEEQSAYYTVGCEVNPIKLMSVRAGLNQEGSVTAGLGINIWPLKVDYAFSQHEEFGALNKISVTLRWGNIYEANVEPQKKYAKTDAILLKGLYNELVFNASVPNFKVKEWDLVIRDADKNTVRRMQGESRPAEKIVWDMTDDYGQPVKRGTYTYTFDIEYFNDKTWQSQGNVTLDFNAPEPGVVELKVHGDNGKTE